MSSEGDVLDTTEEEILTKHRQERKELQSKIQTLKRSATKGDKKKKKEVADAITKLEKELEEKQSRELSTFEKPPLLELEDAPIETPNSEETPQEEQETAPTRVSRAQKRRNKKLAEDQEREKRISEQEETNKQGPRMLELNAIKAILNTSGLQLHNIPADGNCLYCAVNHQLDVTGRDSFSVPKLRKLTAKFMKDNKDEFLPFMCNDSEEMVDEAQFERYCNDVASTKMWGGQLELRALSNVLECPIKVIQANGPTTLQGECFNGQPLILTYHRHLYRLGEHYNSTTALEESAGDDL